MLSIQLIFRKLKMEKLQIKKIDIMRNLEIKVIKRRIKQKILDII
jgi:hypothetical protein